MEETTFQYQTQQSRNKRVKVAAVVGMVVLLAGIIGVLFTRQPKKENIKKDIVVEKKEPSPTEKPKKEKQNVTIQVLNGSGISGQAGIVVKALEDAGYSPDNIKSGNADSTDHINTMITSRADFEEIVADIKEILKPAFPEIIDGVLNPNPNEDGGFDVMIITGSKATITSNPSPSTTPIVPNDTPRPTTNSPINP